jgi:hypothetical protein
VALSKVCVALRAVCAAFACAVSELICACRLKTSVSSSRVLFRRMPLFATMLPAPASSARLALRVELSSTLPFDEEKTGKALAENLEARASRSATEGRAMV